MNSKNYVTIYSIVPKEYMNNSKLNSTDKLLLCHITALCKKNGYCIATNRYFMSIYGISKTSISKSINKLVRLNILNSKIEKMNINSKRRYLTLVNDVWNYSYISVKHNDNMSVEEGFLYNSNYDNKNNNKLIKDNNKNKIFDYDWLNDPDGLYDEYKNGREKC